MALYTPFFQRSAQGLAQGYAQKRVGQLSQNAYMGDQRAMQELAQIDPNAAAQIRQQKMQEEQVKLQQAGQKQQMQANDMQMQQSAQQWALQNRELIQGVMQKAAAMPDFQSAQQLIGSEIQSLQQSGVKIPPGMDAQSFTPEAYEQIKKAFPPAAPETKVVGDSLVNAATGEALFTEPQNAASPAGKLAQDFRNNLIPQDVYEAEVAKLGEDPTQAYIQSLEAQKMEMQLAQERQKMADAEAKKAQEAQQEAAANEALVTQANMVADFVKQAYQLVDTTQEGYTGSALAALKPSGQNAQFRRKLESIKSNIGFDKLMEMKRNSPTGGALGAISVQELVALQSALGSLDPQSSDGEIKGVLNGIYDVYQRINRAAGGSGLGPLIPANLDGLSSDDLVNMLAPQAGQ